MTWTNCEYCFLRGIEVYSSPRETVIYDDYTGDIVGTTCSGWQVDVLITCDLLDVDRYNLTEWPTVSHLITISGSWQEERHSLNEIFSMYDQITTTVSGHMTWAKEYYAGYIMI
jgi:hypothetical protein